MEISTYAVRTAHRFALVREPYASGQTPKLSSQPPVRVLLVTAHPDDDDAFAGAVYQITHQLGGAVDLALVTDGSGGYRYATLAEPIYRLELANEEEPIRLHTLPRR